jgi:excisionase family DNA binding protein
MFLEVIALTTKKAKPAAQRCGKSPTVTLMPPALMDVDSAASYLDMSRSMLYKILLRGDIPSIVLGRKFRRVAVKSLDAWVERQTGGVE